MGVLVCVWVGGWCDSVGIDLTGFGVLGFARCRL